MTLTGEESESMKHFPYFYLKAEVILLNVLPLLQKVVELSVSVVFLKFFQQLLVLTIHLLGALPAVMLPAVQLLQLPFQLALAALGVGTQLVQVSEQKKSAWMIIIGANHSFSLPDFGDRSRTRLRLTYCQAESICLSLFQGCGVGGEISDSVLSKISDSDSLTLRE